MLVNRLPAFPPSRISGLTLRAIPLGQSTLRRVRADYMARLFADTVGFAAAKMIRRILGLAHVADLETIANLDLRATCERRALLLARDMLVNRSRYEMIGDVTSAAAAVLAEPKA